MKPMNTIKTHITAALLVCGMLPASATAAISTAQLNVNVTTVKVTAAINVAGSLSFGSVRDTLTSNAQTTFTVNVNNGFPYSIALDGGANYVTATNRSFMKDANGLNGREFALYQDAGRTLAWSPIKNMAGLNGTGAAQTYTIYGSLLAAAGTSGAISDTVNITVTY